MIKPQNNVKITIKASQLEEHRLFFLPSGNLELELNNDTAKKCIFIMFPYMNAGNMKSHFVKLVEPSESFPFTKEIKENEAYAIKCALENVNFEWKDLPVLIVGSKSDYIVHAKITNGKIVDFETGAKISEVIVSPKTRVWFIVKNTDQNYWSFDIITEKERVAKEGELIKFYTERYWPPLKQNQVVVIGPTSFKAGTYKGGLHDHYCKDCPTQSEFRIKSD
ncbi:MAG: hypothetical protein N3F05_03385 [Candidatus Diapherotrites archaeon]|nr:hypothetical protein [Candidatus Diapherotrites archaeon]